MKVSYNWLKEYLNLEIEPAEVARILTDCGLEVEAMEKFESVKGGLKGVVIGQVLETRKHPNADKLTCCRVSLGGDDPLDIVCGAPNVAPGQKVPVATVGTVIHKGDESFTIKASKLRGEPSEGMICAEDELGLGDDHSGIMVLSPDAPVGMPAAEYFGITNDTILEVAITPNRSDAASHFGVARDLAAAINHRETQHQPVTFVRPSVDAFSVDNHDLPIPVVIENPEACLRYAGVTISGVKVEESPEWLKTRLRSVGLRPINNIVDITNFVLFETGQPLHAFDAKEVKGGKIVVKKVMQDTRFITLDGIERVLDKDDLMICNTEEPMCIGGVFGGIKSGVTDKTTAIFLESAYFDPVHIRKTSKLHGLKTDASFRFERGADPTMTIYALKRAALLIKEIAGGEISSEIVDEYPKPINPHTVEVNFQRMNSLIGKEIPAEKIKAILHALEIEITGETVDHLILSIPAYRVDVTREADVVEEVLRIYGYNNIGFGETLHSSLSYRQKPDPEYLLNLLSDYLTANGFNEILTNSLSRSSYYEKSEVFSAGDSVKIINPLSRDLEHMRQTMIFSGLESIAYNINRKSANLKFYEFGRVYSVNMHQPKDAEVTKRYNEQRRFAIFITGDQLPESWYHATRKADYPYLKSFLFALLRKAGIELYRLQLSEPDARIYGYGETFSISGKPLAVAGKLNAALLKEFDLKQEVFYAEVNWETLLQEVKHDQVKFREVPRFPEVRRDLAMLLDKKVKFSDIEALAYKNGRSILRAVNLFDVYEGEKLGAGKKSYAVSFILQDEQKTLTDQEIDKLMQCIAETLEKELGAVIRK